MPARFAGFTRLAALSFAAWQRRCNAASRRRCNHGCLLLCLQELRRARIRCRRRRIGEGRLSRARHRPWDACGTSSRGLRCPSASSCRCGWCRAVSGKRQASGHLSSRGSSSSGARAALGITTALPFGVLVLVAPVVLVLVLNFLVLLLSFPGLALCLSLISCLQLWNRPRLVLLAGLGRVPDRDRAAASSSHC